MARRCDVCKRSGFKNQRGLNLHKALKHPDLEEKSVAIQEDHTAQTTHIPSELYAYTVGKIEGVISQLAHQYDLPPKQFARGCAEHLLRSARR